jgi:hypothetical protein
VPSRGASSDRKEVVVVIALSGGFTVFLVVVIVFGIGAVIALYTRRGSGMEHHAYRHVHGGAPGADLPSDDYSGSDRTSVTEREVVGRWRRSEQPPKAPPEERARERERTQRPAPGKKPPTRPPL